jgi:hypothetical protein
LGEWNVFNSRKIFCWKFAFWVVFIYYHWTLDLFHSILFGPDFSTISSNKCQFKFLWVNNFFRIWNDFPLWIYGWRNQQNIVPFLSSLKNFKEFFSNQENQILYFQLKNIFSIFREKLKMNFWIPLSKRNYLLPCLLFIQSRKNPAEKIEFVKLIMLNIFERILS